MTCDVQSLLDDARCFHGVNPRLHPALIAALWCSAAEAVAGAVAEHVALQSDDGLWYQLRAASGGDTIQMGPLTPDAGDNAYLVLVDLTDGLKYKFMFVGTGDDVTWQTDGPTLEAETPTTIYAGAVPFTLHTVDSGLTFQLNPV
jgi:hypothetical protein